MPQDEANRHDKMWLAGNRAAWAAMYEHCLRQLGYEGRTSASLLAEREAAVAMLREVCDQHGDNDWDNDLHLADVIEKHLFNHLEADES